MLARPGVVPVEPGPDVGTGSARDDKSVSSRRVPFFPARIAAAPNTPGRLPVSPFTYHRVRARPREEVNVLRGQEK